MEPLLPAGAASDGRGGGLLYRDIHAPNDLLPALAEARHYSRDLILLTSNAGQYDLAVNLIANLASFALHNYLLIADNQVLAMKVKRRGAVAAVWSSLFDRFTIRPNATGCPVGCVDPEPRASPSDRVRGRARRTEDATCAKAAGHCPKSAAAFYRADTVRRLWLMRIHYTSRLLGPSYRVL